MIRKILKVLQAIIAIIFILVNVFLILLNWKIYRSQVELKLGFNTWNTSLGFFLFFFALLSILAIWLLSYIKDLQDENEILKKEEEIRKLRSGQSKKDFPGNEPESDEEDYL